MSHIPELLAPAGHVEAFFAAIENGADSIYLGLKKLSARASAPNFSLDELSSLVPYAHKKKVLIYVALNAAMTASEFPGILDTLQSLSDIKVDGLIVQDPGIFYAARRFFPDLRLHASTLMAVHNSAGVRQMENMGAARVVLARELNLKEIEIIAGSTRAELEIFVHGALCYSFSGLCMASSFRGGHSGLQGRCVQPCRLKFRQGRDEGFYLSCNDFCALPLIPRLKRLRLAAFKIEGRMKSADYIALVVKAYRHILDAPPGAENEATFQAQEWLLDAPSRRLTSGYLSENFKTEILTPHRSGASGIWVGSVKGVTDDHVLIELRHDVRVGDRLRPESGRGKEMGTLTVSRLLSAEGNPVSVGHSGDRVLLARQGDIALEDRLFRIGVQSKPASELWRKLRKSTPNPHLYRTRFPHPDSIWENWPSIAPKPRTSEPNLIIKIGSTDGLSKAFQVHPRFVMLTATRSNLERLARQKVTPSQRERFLWSLPPLLAEKEMDYYRRAIKWYVGKGFHRWELNNWGHFDLFDADKNLRFIAGYRFNVRNAGALAVLAQAGCRWSVLSLEITREELQHLATLPLSAAPVITVYGWPPLFSSRLLPRLKEDKPFTTPRREPLYLRKRGEYSFIYADRPINWFGLMPLLIENGYRNFLLDFSEGPDDQMKKFDQLLNEYWKSKPTGTYSLFNFDKRP